MPKNSIFPHFGDFGPITFKPIMIQFYLHTPIQCHTPTTQQLVHPLGVPLLASCTLVAMTCALCWWLRHERGFMENPSYGEVRCRPLVRQSAYLLGSIKLDRNSFRLVFYTYIGSSLQILAENTRGEALFKIVLKNGPFLVRVWLFLISMN